MTFLIKLTDIWYKRYQEEGEEGLRDKSRRPSHSPLATSSEVVAKIVYLRQNYHFGVFRIQMYLKRYHEIILSKSGIWRILKRLNMNLLTASQRYKMHKDRWIRYEKPQLGYRIDGEEFYNFERPHSALNSQTPYERFREKAKLESVT